MHRVSRRLLPRSLFRDLDHEALNEIEDIDAWHYPDIFPEQPSRQVFKLCPPPPLHPLSFPPITDDSSEREWQWCASRDSFVRAEGWDSLARS